jgi:DNA-binding SARP family transcriptional activator/tetratricopeptide (TPR) repeat protein
MEARAVTAATEFRVLGPVEFILDGVAIHIGSSTQRTLLALLLIHRNEVVSTDRIVELLWPDNPPEARRKLWFHVSKLRGILQPGEAEDATGGILVTRPTGYMLRVDANQLDSARFEDLAMSGRSELEVDPAGAAEALREALAIWRGEPFEDVVHEEAVSSEIARWNALRLGALEDRLEADLAVGRDSELIPELEVLVEEHPFREHFRAQLMIAFYRAGRQADALAAYGEGRRELVEELGIEPGEELRDLQRRILAHDPALARPRRLRHPFEPLETPTGGPAAPGDTEAPLAWEERKVVTVFFADLVDFTPTAERLDPEDVRAFLMPYYAHIRSELERFGGRVEKFIGDAVMALFGAAMAHEDDPERAVRAALAIRDWLVEQAGPQQARIAVATGEAHVTLGGRSSEGEPMAVGDVINTAARLQAAAPVNGVLVGEQTFRATREMIEYREAEPIAAKGKSEPIKVWEAIRARAEPRVDLPQPRASFFGRVHELAALQERLAWAASQRSPQLVTLLGVPGIGKSRLVSELQQAATGAEEPLTWRQGRSLPYGDGVSFWALGEMVKAEAEILESDPAERAEHKLGEAVERIVDDPAEAARITTSLGALVGLGGGGAVSGDRRRETFAAWCRFLEALADERPLVLVFEDMHWADEGLLDFVDELADRVSGVPLLVVATARPELLERRPGWAGGKPNALTISLPPLSQNETARLVAALLEHQALQPGSQEALLPRVGGNPLYAEQFCRMLVESGRFEDVPETVHSIIAARLDALPHEEKRLLQDAAVVGRVFWIGALEAIGGVSREHAEEVLYPLSRREFVQRDRRSSVAGDTEYSFRHVLLRDVAYGAIPRKARAGRHRLAAQWIESLGRPEDHAELLAHHYLSALDYARAAGEDIAEQSERARLVLRVAGERAIRLSANDRAVEYFTRAIELAEQLPEGDQRSRTEAELQLQLGIALLALRGHSAPEVEHAYARATELLMTIAPAAEHLPIHFGLWIFHTQRGNFARSTPLVDRMAELASEGDESMRLQALHARWGNSLFGGRIEDSIAAAGEGQAIYRPDAHHPLSFRYGNHDPGVCALSHQAVALALGGQSVTAVEQMRKAVELSEAVGHAVSRAEPLSYLPWIFQINGDVDAAVIAADRALALEGEVVHPVFFGIAHAMRGWALTRMGRHTEGIEELQKALADQVHVANHINAVIIGAILAEAHLRHERPDAARSLIDQIRPLAESMHTCTFEPELLRVEAEWLRRAGREADARRLLLQATETAQEQGSWALAVRAAVDLTRTSSAKREADLRLLGDLFDRLPAENDTDYARNAKALLPRFGTATVP